MATVTVTGSGTSVWCSASINGKEVTSAGTHEVSVGSKITLTSGTGPVVIVDGVTVFTGNTSNPQYSYTVTGDCTINLSYNQSMVGTFTITTASSGGDDTGGGDGMAGKTLIDGTAYTIKGGKAMVDGTVYGIAKGKTLVDGTAYEIGFGGGDVTITMSGKFNKSHGYVTVAGTKYMEAAEIVVPAGTQITVYVSASLTSYRPYCQVVKDGVTVKSGDGDYSFEAEKDTTLVFTNNTGGRTNCYSCTITTT